MPIRSSWLGSVFDFPGFGQRFRLSRASSIMRISISEGNTGLRDSSQIGPINNSGMRQLRTYEPCECFAVLGPSNFVIVPSDHV